jgi:hypothetical protein
MNNIRFTVDEKQNGVIIDGLNPANSGKFHGSSVDVQDEVNLRETVLYFRLWEITDKLIKNMRPLKTHFFLGENQEENIESKSILLTLHRIISASRLNSIELGVSIKQRFDGTLKHAKIGMHTRTSLWLFRDDLECLLRDLYGDIQDDVLEDALHAAFGTVEEFTRFVRTDIWREHQDAWESDYACGIGVPEGYGISGSEWRAGVCAQDDLGDRILEVLANPTTFSEYTIRFVTWLAQEWPGLARPRAERESERAQRMSSYELDDVPF